MLTPDTLTRHELAGLPVRVAAASGTQTGLAGRVLRETTQTLVIRTESGDNQVPKAGTVFEFAIGARLSARPAASDLFGGPADGTGTGVVSGVSPLTDDRDRVESELPLESDGDGDSSVNGDVDSGSDAAGAGDVIGDGDGDEDAVGAGETVQRGNDGDDSTRAESSSTDEAADARTASGTASKLGTETAGVRPRQSGPSADLIAGTAASRDGDATDGVTETTGECEDVAYVTVDGSELVSRPAERSERGVSTWR